MSNMRMIYYRIFIYTRQLQKINNDSLSLDLLCVINIREVDKGKDVLPRLLHGRNIDTRKHTLYIEVNKTFSMYKLIKK